MAECYEHDRCINHIVLFWYAAASSHSDVELTTSTASEISEMTSSYLIPDSPPGGRQLKSRILNSRMYVEAIEMAEMR